MIRQPSLPLRIVDGRELDEAFRTALRPGEIALDRDGRARRLPRFFYEVPSWDMALGLRLTPHFELWEFLNVDVREAEVMRTFPRYIPCAIALLATHLEVFRAVVGTFVHISANGGYRSPAHGLSRFASPHMWATAANIYRVGDDWLDDEDRIEKYNRIARKHLPGVWARPYGQGEGFADDHIHLDLGYATVVPHDAPGEEGEEDTPAATAASGTARETPE